MSEPKRGLYETLISEALQSELANLDSSLKSRRENLRSAEAADRITFHLARIFERAIAAIAEEDRATAGIELARQIIDVIRQLPSGANLESSRPVSPGEVLHGIFGHLPDGRRETIKQPLIPLLDTTLLTNAPGEPRVGSQVLEEIPSADRIDIVMAFIRQSGISPLLESLR